MSNAFDLVRDEVAVQKKLYADDPLLIEDHVEAVVDHLSANVRPDAPVSLIRAALIDGAAHLIQALEKLEDGL